MSVDVGNLVKKYGKPLSEMLSIDLSKGDSAYAKWLLAAILYSRPLPEEAALGSFETLEHRGQVSPAAIEEAGREQIMRVLEKNGYTRYGSTVAGEIVDAFGDLLKRYDGKLSRLYDMSEDSKDLERRVRSLGKGLDPVAAFVFLRDMRAVWPKANPEPAPRVRELMNTLDIDDLKEYAREHDIDLIRLETALCRYTREEIVSQRASTEKKYRERYRPHAMR
ncbi:MAG: hypothetical protein A4E28_02729 [Methanocella sp. PtaU1.Bin125]|nr:MAG: hypothetical protein A4E28_02729 [Methanocella sp. PtaU1.Bin125]